MGDRPKFNETKSQQARGLFTWSEGYGAYSIHVLAFMSPPQLDCPENIIPIFQPPHSPELNPIERFWEFLKSKLQWENCKTLAQLRQKLAEALKAITPEQIASLTSYDFIFEALFSAAS